MTAMKVFIIVIFVLSLIIFLVFTALLLGEYVGAPLGDTVLFNLNGDSVGLSGSDVPEIPPWLAGLIYIFGIILIAASVKVKFFPESFIIINGIWGILLLLFYHAMLPGYPPFGHTECFSISICIFIVTSYLAVISLFLLIPFCMAKRKANKAAT